MSPRRRVEESTENAPPGRYAEPEEVAAVAALLASDEAAYVSRLAEAFPDPA